MKFCPKCKTEKNVSEFHLHRDGLQPYCKPCMVEYRRLKRYRYPKLKAAYLKKYPWAVTRYAIQARVGSENHRAYLNIKNFLTLKDLKHLWFRDKAHELKRPSIDRIDSSKNYTLDNCRYIELSQNIGRQNILRNG